MKRLFMAIAACFCVALSAQAATTFELPDEFLDVVPPVLLPSGLNVPTPLADNGGTLVVQDSFQTGDSDDDVQELATFDLDTVGTHIAFLSNITGFANPASISVQLLDGFGGNVIGTFNADGFLQFDASAGNPDFFRVVTATTEPLTPGGDPAQYFFNVAQIPEPATWLMMIIGFAVVGLQMRRRNRQVVDFA